LVGSGDRIALFMVPFVVAGLILNLAFPEAFDVGGPPPLLRAVSIVALVAGIVVWAWSVVLNLARVPRGQLITTGPFALVKHPLYTGAAFSFFPGRASCSTRGWAPPWAPSCMSQPGSTRPQRRPSWPVSSLAPGRSTPEP
jgi:protein-S-isoprenylcysteine O-methyltransferase Ste14